METSNAVEIVRLAEILILVFPLVVYAIGSLKLHTAFHAIGINIIIFTACNSFALYLYEQRIHNIGVFNIYFILFFITMSLFYYLIAFKKPGWRKIVVFGTIIYFISYVLITLYIQPFDRFQGLAWAIGNVILFIYSLFYFGFLAIEMPWVKSSKILQGSLFINVGIASFCILTFLLFSITDEVLHQENKEQARLIWSLHNFTSILRSILFTIGLYIAAKAGKK